MRLKMGKNSVRFEQPFNCYMTGEIAGFDGESAKWLQSEGIATIVRKDGQDPPPVMTKEDAGSLVERVKKDERAEETEETDPSAQEKSSKKETVDGGRKSRDEPKPKRKYTPRKKRHKKADDLVDRD